MKQISFSEFYRDTKKDLSLADFKSLEPMDMYFYCHGSYIAASYNPQKNGVWISFWIGHGLDGMREFLKFLRGQNVDLIGFLTAEGNKPMLAMCKYCGVELRKTGERYADGKMQMLGELPLVGKRFQSLEVAA